jgi:DNA mismatch repair protein MutS2
MSPVTQLMDKLEWPLLLGILAEQAQTEEGRGRCLELVPALGRDDILERWQLVEPLKRLTTQGYRAPIGEILPLSQVFKAASLGQILGGQDLRAVADLLEATRRVHGFAVDFAARCSTLVRLKARLYPIPALHAAINKAVGKEGELLDDSSVQLQNIRRQKLSVRKRIEESLKKMLHEGELLPYLQDDFFTVRSERYVVPMRLDGRGRVKGSILDTSDSGQTLFIEPAQIAPINDQLQELDLEEKLEILRIFRELSGKVAGDVEALSVNYSELVELDFLSAQAQLAADIGAGTVDLADAPGLDLIEARHPLVKRAGGRTAIGNDISLRPAQKALIVSGPNAGGKTVVLKTVGLLHVMAKAGLLLPADAASRLFLFEKIHLEMGDAQSLSANLSTFSGHLLGLKPILAQATDQDLILLDELAVGTDPETGAAIGQAILEDLADRRATTLVTTHFDALKGLAVKDDRFRNGSMEYSLHNLQPTYKLILDVPGQSYGLEVAEQMGLPPHIIQRAKGLRGHSVSALDAAVTQLMQARDETRQKEQALAAERLAAEAERTRWQQEVELLRETRRKTAEQLAAKYEGRMADLKAEFEELTKKLRQSYKDAAKQPDSESLRQDALGARRDGEKTLREMDGLVSELGQLSSDYGAADKLPGQPAAFSALRSGTPVYVLPLKKAGTVVKPGAGESEPIEVEVGVIKLRVSLHDLRLLSPGEAAGGGEAKAARGAGGGAKPQTGRGNLRPAPPRAAGPYSTGGGDGTSLEYFPQTPTNSIDLRGRDSASALEATWNFIDRALMRGEPAVILIHGHGTDKLKSTIREALRNNCPYDVRFRPGIDQEGGDGVTIVELSR